MSDAKLTPRLLVDANPLDNVTPEHTTRALVAIALKSIYGRTRAYPDNELAKRLALFANVATFNARQLGDLEAIGFTIEASAMGAKGADWRGIVQ